MQVSVLITTYNPSKEKLFQTVKSVLWQKNIDFEIILSDDGSKEDYFEDVEALFKKERFINYRFVKSYVNTGTVYNYYRAVCAANGDYIKGMAPGDLLYNEFTLADWYNFMLKNSISISFSYPIYYYLSDMKLEIVKKNANPAILDPYRPNKKGLIDIEKLKLNYLIVSDIIVGSSLMLLRTLSLEYTKRILGRVVYAEDNIYRLMILDNIPIYYYSQLTLWYEWGCGISTSGNPVWAARLIKDWLITNDILESMLTYKKDVFSIKFKKLLIAKRRNLNPYFIRAYILYLFPKSLKMKLKRRLAPVKTPNSIKNTDFFWKCFE